MQVKNQYDLIREHERLQPDSHMFSKDTLRFWGNKKSRMRLAGKVSVRDFRGAEHECYRLETIADPPHPDMPKAHTYYFDTETLERIVL